ncbi:MarR family winged helix-turn-helix transcriptional regulator [Nocardia zapadnayensis]|uniref:MarR family winged helix-turn-helix transcriptional regulator n=1 Tax=Nocardia rhamnosiphila TaxID=426716 RepID=UPI0022472B16|nr:MarR family winged helix-turn-helix transcriptional regulator [Nocardia zapadnayensis]MCX0274738.1 MarR family winged helix-turn-helix transcriptional regulator [Nocardia zapadnayensis]
MGTTDRPDLAAMLAPLTRTLIALERPILEAHGLTMWAYTVLIALSRGSARGQGVLAQEIGADKTRIIAVLDDLQERGLIERTPDPADRRARLLALTPEGHRIAAAVQTEIQARENEQVLEQLPAADRRGFLNALRILTELPRDSAPDGNG